MGGCREMQIDAGADVQMAWAGNKTDDRFKTAMNLDWNLSWVLCEAQIPYTVDI